MSVTKANFIREFLFRNYSDFPVVLDKVTAAAIQVSLREIVGENSGTFNLRAGDVQYRSWSVIQFACSPTPCYPALLATGLI